MDRGLELSGMRCIHHVEIRQYNRAILEQHWPGVPKSGDIRNFDGRRIRADVVAGGFPCQDTSIANPFGKGIGGEKSGLWSEFARVIREVRPRYAIVENSPALRWRGLGRVLGDLAEIGFDAEWQVLSASAFGADSIRERLFIVAYPMRKGLEGEGIPVFSDPPSLRPIRRPLLSQSDVLRANHGIPFYVERIEGIGSAVHPEVARWVGEQVIRHHAATVEVSK